MNKREKEEYLREYAILKSQGKPFFPYAVMKDSLMACVVMAVIIGMSLLFGAELGSKANPTTTTYVPRPEWYFFFLFELSARDQAGEPGWTGDYRHTDDRHDPAVPAAVLRSRPGASAGAPADRHVHRHLRDRSDGAAHLPRR